MVIDRNTRKCAHFEKIHFGKVLIAGRYQLSLGQQIESSKLATVFDRRDIFSESYMESNQISSVI